MKKLIDKKTMAYLGIGILNFLLCTGIMFLLYNVCHVSSHIAPLVNYGLGSVIWYLACRFVLFRESRTTPKRLLLFAANVVICYVFSYYAVALPLSKLLLKSRVVQVAFDFAGISKIDGNCRMTVGAAIYAIANYFGQRFFVFRERTSDASAAS